MIGNRHFKTWLKSLDPVTRVEKMRDIAKSQATTGLKGSLIKESLAQLSQRCQVMLIKLTDEEISRYTRKKDVKRLDQKIYISKTKDYTKKQSLCTRPIHKKKESLTKHPIKDEFSILSPANKHNSKLEQKIRDLFGDDPDDHTITKDSFHNVPSGFDKNVNQYVSNTFNVNIFKSSSNSHSATDQISEGGSSAGKGVKNRLPNKILRIDVSLCNEDSDVKSNFCSSSSSDSKGSHHKSKGVKQSSKTKRKYSSISSSRNNEAKPKRKKTTNRNHSGSLSLNEDEDPTIEELWKILGMESPTDRSESIIKSYPLPTQGPSSENPQDTLNQNVSVPSATTQKTNYSSIADVTENGSQNPARDFTESSKEIKDTGPDCEIANAFNLPSKPHTNSTRITVIGQIHDADKIKDKVETISLLNDDIDDPNATEAERNDDKEKQVLEKSKIGTIRVRDIGSLMKSPSSRNNASVVASNQDQPSTSRQLSVSTNSTNETYTVADQFIVTYRHYFDELVELKIPNMGELLHLAIADLNRKHERIKRAEQLSSEELIFEEKQRAEKELNDMMRVRGVELNSLCETILNTFDRLSKKTLFIALFCRLLKHAEYIDPANKQYTLEAKNVMYMMLTKTNFKDKEIVDLLSCDFVPFSQQVDAVHNLIEQLNVPRTNNTLVQPRPQSAIASESQSLLPKSTSQSCPVNICNATISHVGLTSKNSNSHNRLYSENQSILHESLTNNRLIQLRPQPTITSEPQSLPPKPTSQAPPVSNCTSTIPQLGLASMNGITRFIWDGKGNVTQIAPNVQLQQKVERPEMYKAVIQNELTNNRIAPPRPQIHTASKPQLQSPKPPFQASSITNTVPKVDVNNMTDFNLDSEGQLLQKESQMNSRINLMRSQTTITKSLSPKSIYQASPQKNCNNTIPQVSLNAANNMTRFRVDRASQVIRIARNEQLEPKQRRPHMYKALMVLKDPNNSNAPVSNAGESKRSYLLSSTNTLQLRNPPELASISSLGSNVQNVQMAIDKVIRGSPTSVPNNDPRSQINPPSYAQALSNAIPNLTIVPMNPCPNIAAASSAQLETVGQRNWQDRSRPENGLINVPQTPRRIPIILSRPTSSSNTQERTVTSVQKQPSVPAVGSVDNNASSQIDDLNKQPHMQLWKRNNVFLCVFVGTEK